MSAKPDKSKRRWWIAVGSFLTYWLWRRWQGGRKREDPGVSDRVLALGHEPEETATGWVVAFAITLMIGVGIVLVLLRVFVGVLDTRRAQREGPVSPYAEYEQVPPPPRLQADPSVDLQLLHQLENRQLFTYGWVDRTEGVVRIPIGRAMELIAERGLPVRDTALAGGPLVVMTESGFVVEELGPPWPPYTPPPFLGSSPEPYTPTPDYRQYLTEEGYLAPPEPGVPVE